MCATDVFSWGRVDHNLGPQVKATLSSINWTNLQERGPICQIPVCKLAPSYFCIAIRKRGKKSGIDAHRKSPGVSEALGSSLQRRLKWKWKFPTEVTHTSECVLELGEKWNRTKIVNLLVQVVKNQSIDSLPDRVQTSGLSTRGWLWESGCSTYDVGSNKEQWPPGVTIAKRAKLNFLWLLGPLLSLKGVCFKISNSASLKFSPERDGLRAAPGPSASWYLQAPLREAGCLCSHSSSPCFAQHSWALWCSHLSSRQKGGNQASVCVDCLPV